MDIQIKLEEIVEILKVGIRRAGAFMGLGINAALDPDFKSILLPDSVSNIRLLPDPIPEELIKNIKEEFKLWIEAGGLREICESLEVYLTAIYGCAMLVNVSDNGRIPAGTKIEIPKAFSRKGLRVKLEMLRENYNVSPSHPEHLASLWNARNCLTHRRGIVGLDDLDDTKFLAIKWLGIDTYFVDPDGTETLLASNFEPFAAINGGEIQIRIAERIRQFSEGDRVIFSGHELSEFCWFSLSQSDGIVTSLAKFMGDKGIAIEVETIERVN